MQRKPDLIWSDEFTTSAMSCGVPGSPPEQQAALHERLLALLPADGTPVTTTELARQTGSATWQVTEALLDDYLRMRLDFDIRADAFSIRQGGH